jgi:hypothetical protein
VLVTISDKKLAVDSDNDGIINYYNADVVTANDYYPFGMTMPGRDFTITGKKSRHSINGQERSDELNDNLTTALYWEYDSRIGRRWNVDPVRKEYESPFMCFGDNPIWMSDAKGNVYVPNNGETGPGKGTSTRDNPSVIGTAAHSALSRALEQRNSLEFNPPVSRKWVTNTALESGKRPDVIDEVNKKVWELKPASNQPYNTSKNKLALTQINNYVDELNATRGGGYSAGGTIYQVPIVAPQRSADGKYIFIYFVADPKSGILYYTTTKLEPDESPKQPPIVIAKPNSKTVDKAEPIQAPVVQMSPKAIETREKASKAAIVGISVGYIIWKIIAVGLTVGSEGVLAPLMTL